MSVVPSLKSLASSNQLQVHLAGAAPISIETVQDCVTDEPSLEEVRFVCFSGEDYAVYQRDLQQRGIEVNHPAAVGEWAERGQR